LIRLKRLLSGTSIGLVPSGRIAATGFTDGTLSLFDLPGIFAKDNHHPDNQHLKSETSSDSLFDNDASSSDESFQSFASSPTKNSKSLETLGLLGLIQVDHHADAKLNGLVSCLRLWNGWERARYGVKRLDYLSLTENGIKVRLTL